MRDEIQYNYILTYILSAYLLRMHTKLSNDVQILRTLSIFLVVTIAKGSVRLCNYLRHFFLSLLR